MRRSIAALVSSSVLLAVALSPSPAWANGRFPETNKITFAPGDPQTMLLRVTFGVLLSKDRGATWDWICEEAVGFSGVEDPMYALSPSGKIFSSTFLGLSVSPDRGCSWDFVRGELDQKLFVDLSQRPSQPESIVFFASSYRGQNDAGVVTFASDLFETTDDGKTFRKLEGVVDPALLGETVDVAPSDTERLYLSGVREPGATPRAFVLASTDRGKTWTEAEVPLVPGERSLFIAGVDPKNADRVYVRTSAATDKPTRVLVSDDAGKTFRAIFTGKGALRGFALSPDGSRVWIGGPADGLHAASTADFAFTPRTESVKINCLTAAEDGLWACSDEASGFVAGVSTDDGVTFQPKLRFCDIRGPLACPEGSTTHVQCTLGDPAQGRQPPWPIQRAGLGCGVADGGAGSGGDASVAATPATPEDDGCSCSTSANPSWALLGGVGTVLAVMLRRVRRRP